ncbi:MAG: hypothetical protein ABEJ22_02075 [Haloferacaceae archaeon]
MPSRYEHAVEVTRDSRSLAAVPAVATLLSLSKVATALESGPGGGVTFPFPTGLPTLWTYVSLPNGAGGVPVSAPLGATAFAPLFLVGLLLTSALEAGLLGSLSRRIDGDPVAFGESVRAFTVPIVGVNLVRFAVVLVALPFLVVPPLALLVVVALSYLVYGLPFAVVVRGAGVRDALDSTVSHAFDGGPYASFGFAHLLVGAVGSFFLTSLVRNAPLVGVPVGTLVVAVPAVFVATYGLLLFRDLDGRGGDESNRDGGGAEAVPEWGDDSRDSSRVGDLSVAGDDSWDEDAGDDPRDAAPGDDSRNAASGDDPRDADDDPRDADDDPRDADDNVDQRDENGDDGSTRDRGDDASV